MNNTDKTYLEPTEGFHRAMTNALDALPEKKAAHRPARAAAVIIAAAAALCVSAAAGSLIAFQTSWTNAEPDFTELPSQSELERRFGYPYKAVEKFSNGFEYTGGFVTHNDQFDADGGHIDGYDSFSCEYSRGGSYVSLITREAVGEDAELSGEVAESYNGLDIRYTASTFFLVPDNFEITEADSAALANGKYSFSFGEYDVSDEDRAEIASGESKAAFSYIGGENQTIAVKHQKSVEWIDDGRLYWISYVGGENIAKDELVGMAKEIIG